MKKISLVIILSCLISTGCVTPLSGKGQHVMVVTHMNTTKCTSLGFVSASSSTGWDPGQNTESSINKLKNQTAFKGGNALYLISNQAAGLLGGHVVMSAQALKCVQVK